MRAKDTCGSTLLPRHVHSTHMLRCPAHVFLVAPNPAIYIHCSRPGAEWTPPAAVRAPIRASLVGYWRLAKQALAASRRNSEFVMLHLTRQAAADLKALAAGAHCRAWNEWGSGKDHGGATGTRLGLEAMGLCTALARLPTCPPACSSPQRLLQRAVLPQLCNPSSPFSPSCRWQPCCWHHHRRRGAGCGGTAAACIDRKPPASGGTKGDGRHGAGRPFSRLWAQGAVPAAKSL